MSLSDDLLKRNLWKVFHLKHFVNNKQEGAVKTILRRKSLLYRTLRKHYNPSALSMHQTLSFNNSRTTVDNERPISEFLFNATMKQLSS